MKIIPYGKQQITQQDIDAVVEALTSDFLTQGPRIAQFESEFANYIGCRFAVAVSNGTAALHLATLSLGLTAGSRVITTPITFAASANCVRYCGGIVEFCDIDSKTYLLDLDKLEALLSGKPKGYYSGVIPVDFAGYPLDMDRLKALADKFGFWILEDACHAPGATFTNTAGYTHRCGDGAYADLAVFSFHPVKHIATGEGGMITTNDEELYHRLVLLRTHGITKDPSMLKQNHGGWYYEMQSLGYNYRLTDFQAALGISQLKKADLGLKRRREIADTYTKAFADLPLKLPEVGSGIGHAFHLFVVQCDRRRELYDYLHDRNIKAQVHYIPLHTMPYYADMLSGSANLSTAESYYDRCLSLPMFPSLSDTELEYIIHTIREFFSNDK